mmetsp:Transcript_94759/g.237693  ORF Transcript_94759/g.237693 Transcript_94759/m.237693 type:complete len:275 (-) Transcript_94759:399-1223(-)
MVQAFFHLFQAEASGMNQLTGGNVHLLCLASQAQKLVVSTGDLTDVCPDAASGGQALVGVPHPEAAATPPSIPGVLIRPVPPLSVLWSAWPLGPRQLPALDQRDGVSPLRVGARRAHVRQAPPRLHVPQAEGALRQQTRVQVDVLEAPQEPREGLATQALLHGAEGADVHLRPSGVGHVRVVVQLHREVPPPPLRRPGPVLQGFDHLDLVVGLGPRVVGAPHVRHLRVRQRHNLPAAEPRAQRLVDVLAAPVLHVGVVAARLLPPTPADAEQTS